MPKIVEIERDKIINMKKSKEAIDEEGPVSSNDKALHLKCKNLFL